jgi:hypothetical protein
MPNHANLPHAPAWFTKRKWKLIRRKAKIKAYRLWMIVGYTGDEYDRRYWHVE